MRCPKIRKTAYGVKLYLCVALCVSCWSPRRVPSSRDGEAIALRNMMDQYLMLGWQVDMLCMITPSIPTVLPTSRNKLHITWFALQKCMQIPARANGVACSTCWGSGLIICSGLTNLLLDKHLPSYYRSETMMWCNWKDCSC